MTYVKKLIGWLKPKISNLPTQPILSVSLMILAIVMMLPGTENLDLLYFVIRIIVRSYLGKSSFGLRR